MPAAAGEVVEEERQQERAEPATPEALQPPIISAAAGEEEATADEEAAGDPAAAAARDPPGGAEGAVEAATDTGGEGAASEDGEDAEVAGLAARLHSVLAVEEETGVALKRPPLLSSFDLEGVADLIRSGRAKRIVLMCGAGISVSAGWWALGRACERLTHPLPRADRPCIPLPLHTRHPRLSHPGHWPVLAP